jgi:hypothetical protein
MEEEITHEDIKNNELYKSYITMKRNISLLHNKDKILQLYDINKNLYFYQELDEYYSKICYYIKEKNKEKREEKKEGEEIKEPSFDLNYKISYFKGISNDVLVLIARKLPLNNILNFSLINKDLRNFCIINCEKIGKFSFNLNYSAWTRRLLSKSEYKAELFGISNIEILEMRSRCLKFSDDIDENLFISLYKNYDGSVEHYKNVRITTLSPIYVSNNDNNNN